MARLRVNCIRRSGSNYVGEGIVAIGGQGWIYTEAEAIKKIKLGIDSFYVEVLGHQTEVIVATTYSGKEFLKTVRDSYAENNLLSLPNCL